MSSIFLWLIILGLSLMETHGFFRFPLLESHLRILWGFSSLFLNSLAI